MSSLFEKGSNSRKSLDARKKGSKAFTGIDQNILPRQGDFGQSGSGGGVYKQPTGGPKRDSDRTGGRRK